MAISYEEDEVLRALMFRERRELAATRVIIPYLRAHLGAVSLKAAARIRIRATLEPMIRGNRLALVIVPG